jgi:hypothetical protein
MITQSILRLSVASVFFALAISILNQGGLTINVNHNHEYSYGAATYDYHFVPEEGSEGGEGQPPKGSDPKARTSITPKSDIKGDVKYTLGDILTGEELGFPPPLPAPTGFY